MAETLGGLSDPDVRDEAIRLIGGEFPMWLGEGALLSRVEGGLRVQAGDKEVIVEKALVALGRRSLISTGSLWSALV